MHIEQECLRLRRRKIPPRAAADDLGNLLLFATDATANDLR